MKKNSNLKMKKPPSKKIIQNSSNSNLASSYQREVNKSNLSLTNSHANSSTKVNTKLKASRLVASSSTNLLSSPKLNTSKRSMENSYIFLCKTQSSPDILQEDGTKKRPTPPPLRPKLENDYESLTKFESQTFLKNQKPKKTSPAPKIKATKVNKINKNTNVNLTKSNSSTSLNSRRPSSASSRTSGTSRNSKRSASGRIKRRKLRFIIFMNEWEHQKSIYLNIQIVFLIINFFLTLTRLGLSIWMFVGIRMGILADLANKLLYSSFSKFIGFLPLLFLFINTVSFFIDLSRFFCHFYIRDFLMSHSRKKIEKILQNQKELTMLKLTTNTMNAEFRQLSLRNKITKYLKKVLINLKTVTFMGYFIYIGLIGVQFLIGIVLQLQQDHIVTYQLPQTLIKLIREYERQQMAKLTESDTMFLKMENVITGTLEESLMNQIHTYFHCCNYQNPFQFGDLAPHTCNYNQGCLKPMQDFTWTYIYVSMVVMLFLASVKLLIELILAVNFCVVLLKRLISRVYHADIDMIILDDVVHQNYEEEQKENVSKRLMEIRLAKETLLAKEDFEEEEKLRREEIELKLLTSQDRKQAEYERMLMQQKRFDELEQEKFRRKLQHQFVIVKRETE